MKKNKIYFRFAIFITLLLFINGCINKNINCKPNNYEIKITDKALIDAFNFYLNKALIDTNNNFLWVFIGNEPTKKSFSISDCYYIEDSILRKITYFSKYRGMNIAISTGYENFNQQKKEYPIRFKKITKEMHSLVEHQFYTFEHCLDSGKDTVYYKLKYYYYWVSPISKIIYKQL